MSATTVGVLSPGFIGHMLADAMLHSGHRVIWASGGRSDLTKEHAARCKGLEDVVEIGALGAYSDVIFSICSHEAVRDVAQMVAHTDFDGIFVDSNWIQQSEVQEYDAWLDTLFPDWVEGGVHAEGTQEEGTYQQYFLLRGERAQTVSELFISDRFGLPMILTGGERVRAYKARADVKREQERLARG